MSKRLQIRRDTEANWLSVNPVLLQGEIGFVLDDNGNVVGKKVGNGKTAWDALEFHQFGSGGGVPIVESVDALDPDAPRGSLAVVNTKSTETTISKLDGGTFNSFKLSVPNAIQELPMSPYPLIFTDKDNSNGVTLLLFTDSNELMVIAEMFTESASGSESFELMVNGEIAFSSLEEFNEKIEALDLHFVGADIGNGPESPTENDFEIIDSIVQVMSGNDTLALFIKDDEWVDYYDFRSPKQELSKPFIDIDRLYEIESPFTETDTKKDYFENLDTSILSEISSVSEPRSLIDSEWIEVRYQGLVRNCPNRYFESEGIKYADIDVESPVISIKHSEGGKYYFHGGTRVMISPIDGSKMTIVVTPGDETLISN